jgi:hypothetical protein
VGVLEQAAVVDLDDGAQGRSRGRSATRSASEAEDDTSASALPSTHDLVGQVAVVDVERDGAA